MYYPPPSGADLLLFANELLNGEGFVGTKFFLITGYINSPILKSNILILQL
jgi:hypothetical protein